MRDPSPVLHRPSGLTKLLAAGLLALAVGVAGAVDTPTSAAARDPGPQASAGRPNILFVLTDDLTMGEMQYLPQVESSIGTAGTTFTNSFVNVSLCCPARATILRGQYAHNTGVETNGDTGTNGGFAAMYRLGLESDTIATRLQQGGYRTALFGKYLNGYPGAGGPAHIPAGWDHWASPTGGDPYGGYRYTLNHDGTARDFGSAPQDYTTSVLVGMTQELITRSAQEGRPFFAFLSLYAPHEPATPAPEDVGRFAGTAAPRTAAFDRPDAAGAPTYIRDLPRLSVGQITAIDQLYARRIESLQAVDRGVAALVDTLRAARQLDNTYVVFTSDNGYHLGQNRLPAGKQTPYDTDTRVPLLVRGPGVAPARIVDAIVGNVDLAPTFADIAGVAPPAASDGRSLRPLLRTRSAASRTWRNGFLLEHWRERGTQIRAAAGATANGPSEPLDLDQRMIRPGGTAPAATSGTAVAATSVILDPAQLVPDFTGLRTEQWLYVELETGERELYDVRADPDQQDNLFPEAPESLRHRLASQLAALRSCAAARCRTADRDL